MANLSSFIIEGKRPCDGTAVAADVRAGKSGFTAAGKVVGTAELKPLQTNGYGLILLVQNPTGSSSATYDPISGTPNGLICKSNRITNLTSSGGLDLNTDGYMYDSAAYVFFISGSSMGAAPPPGGFRKYEMWGKTKDAALTTNYGFRTYINRSPSNGDFFHIQLHYTGSVFQLSIRSWIGAVETTHASVNTTAAVGVPMIWHVITYEQGDTIIVSAHCYENDVVTDDEAITCQYTVASRPLKNNPDFAFGNMSTAGDEWLLRGCSVMDIP